jgi:hypothetical protein
MSNRREFMLAAGAAAVAYAPLMSLASGASAVGAPQPSAPPLEDWTIDDMWGVWPRYAEAIGFAPPPEAAPALAHVAAVDLAFVA